MPPITLTTDFGHRDWFVGAMKGVILTVNPRATIVDVTHEVPPGDVRSGAYALTASYRFFPRGTIHVAVVDPGVGSERRAIAVRTKNYTFVGPDNGVLSWALRNEKVIETRQIENERFFRKPVSQTFHGRDIFAPVAAHLSKGKAFVTLGRRLKQVMQLSWPEPARTSDGWSGEVVYIDRFGNCITNLSSDLIAGLRHPEVRIQKHGISLKTSYSAVQPGEPLVVASSSGFLEIAVNGGSAAQKLGISVGKRVKLVEA